LPTQRLDLQPAGNHDDADIRVRLPQNLQAGTKRPIADGMKEGGLAHSGQFGWAETVMYWKVNHMVVPKSQALKCNECHAEKGRLDWKALGYAGDP